jgi:hypothetical protein
MRGLLEQRSKCITDRQGNADEDAQSDLRRRSETTRLWPDDDQPHNVVTKQSQARTAEGTPSAELCCVVRMSGYRRK